MEYGLKSLYMNFIAHVGKAPLEDRLHCPLRMMSKSINFNRNRIWPKLQMLRWPLQAYGLARSFQHLLQDPVLFCLQNCSFHNSTHLRTPCCKWQPAGPRNPVLHSLDPSNNLSILLVFILLYLCHIQEGKRSDLKMAFFIPWNRKTMEICKVLLGIFHLQILLV